MLHGLLGEDGALQPLKRLLIERTGGNPFFLGECVRTLVETKVLSGERGGYRHAGPVTAVQVPATVRAVLAARIDRLSPERKRLLQCAAVIGQTVPLLVLRAVSEEDDEEVRRGLAHLQAAEFIYETTLFPDVEYTFKHALTLEVAYGSLLAERRRSLHRRVLDALSTAAGPTLGENAELLAHHAVRAELWVAWIESGRVDGLEELAERAETLAKALDDRPRLAQVRLRQAQAFWNVRDQPGTLEAAIASAHEALGLAAASDLRTLSYARFIGAAARVDRGRFREATDELEAGLALFGGLEPGRETGLTLPIYVSLRAWESHALVALGDFARAHLALDDGVRIAEQIGHPPGRIFVHVFRAYAHLIRGEFEMAQRAAARGLALAEEHDFFHGIVASALCLGYADLVLGERDRGLSLVARAIEGRDPVSPYMKTWTKYGTLSTAAYLEAGDVTLAAAQVERALPYVVRQEARGYLASLLRLRSELLSRQPEADPAGALRDAAQALALALELGMAPEASRCHLQLGQVYRRIGERQKAEGHLRTARAQLAALGMDFWKADAESERNTG